MSRPLNVYMNWVGLAFWITSTPLSFQVGNQTWLPNYQIITRGWEYTCKIKSKNNLLQNIPENIVLLYRLVV